MINLRYHIVSIVAVFLALGIGISIGTAFIDGVIVDRLETSVQTLEDERVADEERIDELEAQLTVAEGEREGLEAALVPSVAGALLDGTPLLILADEGVEEEAVHRLRDAVAASQASFGGLLWLGPGLGYDDAEARAVLADALDLVDDDEARVRGAVRSGLRRAFVPGRTPGGVADGEVLDRLRDAEVVDYDDTGVALTRRRLRVDEGQRYVVVSGAEGGLVDSTFLADLLIDLRAGAPVAPWVAAEVVAEDPEAGWPVFVDRLREADVEASTVDDLGRTAGVLATLLAADRIGDLEPGAFGLAPSATSILPPP